MASQYNFVHPAAQAPAVNAQRIQVNDRFAQTADLRIAAQRSFMIDGRTVWADERGSGSKSKLYRCSGATFDAKANGDIRKVSKGCPDRMCVCLCPWLAQTVKSLEVVPSAVRQRELILTEKIDIEYSMRYETLALRTVSDI